jgi:NAD(P)H-flavin reductase
LPELCFEGHVYQVDDFDTVLNTLLKNGHAIPNFCRSGICHSCMMKAEKGTPLPFTQIGLSDELAAENYFLTCQCAVYAPMEVRRPDKDKRTRFVAMVRSKESLAEDVVKIQLAPEHDFVYESGQYTTLINVEGVAADYPIASVHGADPLMEFHIPRDCEKPLNAYIFEELEVGDGLEIMTALGDHFYRDDLLNRPLAIVATDGNLAAAYSLISKALHEGHSAGINLLCAGITLKNLYLEKELKQLQATHASFAFQALDTFDREEDPDFHSCAEQWLQPFAAGGAQIILALNPGVADKLGEAINNPGGCWSISPQP